MANSPPIDSAQDRLQYDRVGVILEETDQPGEPISRVQWILYQQLFNRGCRMERAQFEITRMVPRIPR